MPRIAFHLRIKDDKRDDYRDAHENVPEDLERAYLESDAELETYSVFEKDGHVFGYMETGNPEAIREVMENSEAQEQWAEVMAPILQEPDESIWMDEVYRMI